MASISDESVEDNTSHIPQITIIGGGIVGLVLAIGLKARVGVTAQVYEAAKGFVDDVGAGMGMYPNGLRVIRDISPALFDAVKKAGHPYKYRRWERHDGTEVMVADENVLSDRDDDLQTIGIRRWRLQKILFEAAFEAGIPVHFSKRAKSILSQPDGSVQITFEDGTETFTQILFGADGSKSQVRQSVAECGAKLKYTGVTCLMGISEIKSQVRGISLPSSSTSQCHGAFFPTGENEQCFQFHFPVNSEDADSSNWGILTEKVGKVECLILAGRLSREGWHNKYIEPLSNATNAVRIGFCLLDKDLKRFVYGKKDRIVLVGDAAHPPVPYLGQGAQMGLEDAGVIVNLLKELCLLENGNPGEFCTGNFGRAMKIYEKMRMPRTKEIVEKSQHWGKLQQKRTTNKKYNEVKEEMIKRDVFYHETCSHLCTGAKYDFKKDITCTLAKEPVLLPLIEEDS